MTQRPAERHMGRTETLETIENGLLNNKKKFFLNNLARLFSLSCWFAKSLRTWRFLFV